MDTGEGKTYAILPAAFALAIKYHRVYIVCANEYLALRDAKRTKSYWNFVGLSVGLCLSGTDKEEWNQRVIYTTLSTLIFKSLEDDISVCAPLYPISYKCVLIDEADAILLDAAKADFATTHPLKGRSFDWGASINVSKKLVEQKHIVVDWSSRSASLTIEGEMLVKNIIGVENDISTRLMLFRYAIEICYIALNILEEGKDYIIENQSVHPIDLITGTVNRKQTPLWIMPLEYIHGFPIRPRQITLNSVATEIFLANFEHISGLSGTIKGDSLEYLFGYKMPTTTILPRVKRRQGLKDDLIYSTDDMAHIAAYRLAKDANKNGRPVLIGTNNIISAEKIHEIFRNNSPELVVKLITGKNDYEISEIFTHAGQSDSILITTQLAGRGVDIRLSEQAKNNGGLFLISIGHSMTVRHDRQFLGRAGRQGDPWTAQFICSLDDSLMKAFASRRMANLMESLGLKGEETIEHPMVTKAIKRAQRKIRERDFFIRRQESYLNMALPEIRSQAKIWFEQLRYFAHHNRRDSCTKSEAVTGFLEWLAKRYIETKFQHMFKDNAEVSYDKAKIVVSSLNELCVLGNVQCLTESELEGRYGDKAIMIIEKWLTLTLSEIINSAIKENKHNEDTLKLIGEERISLPLTIDNLFSDAESMCSYPNFDIEEHHHEAGTCNTHYSVTLADIIASETIEKKLNELKRLFQEKEETEENHDILNRILCVKERVANIKELCANYRSIYNNYYRTPTLIAHWTVQLVWSDFLEETKRSKHRILNGNYTTREAYRIIYDTTLADWERRRFSLPEQVIKNLYCASSPSKLDDLFWLNDNRAEISRKVPTEIIDWDNNLGAKKEHLKKKLSEIDSLIDQFIQQSDIVTDSNFSDESLRQLLVNFLSESPINTLQTPIRIQSAIENLFFRENNLGLTSQRKRINRRCIKLFLIYLNQQGLIASLPILRHKAYSLSYRLKKSLCEAKTAIFTLATGFYFLVFLLLSLITTDAHPKLTEGYNLYFESLVFGGLLNAATFTAPSFGSIILSLLIIHSLFSNSVGTIRGLGLERYLPIVFQVYFSWLLIDWSYASSSSLYLASALSTFLFMIVFSRITQSVTYVVDNETGLSLIGIWLFYTSTFVVMPIIVENSSNYIVSYLVAISIIALFLFKLLTNKVEIVLSSTRIVDHTMNGEKIDSLVKVGGDGGIKSHVFALLISISIFELIDSLYGSGYIKTKIVFLSHYLAIATYLIILLLVSSVNITQKLSLRAWEPNLNAKHQTVKNAESTKKRKELFSKLSFKLQMKEFTILVIGILFSAYLFKDQLAIADEFPLSIYLIFTAYLIAHYAISIFFQTHNLFFSRITVRQETLNFSLVKDEHEPKGFWVRLNNILRNRISLILTAMLILVQVITLAIESWDLLQYFTN